MSFATSLTVANNFDPSVSGLANPVGTVVETADGTKAWQKFGTGLTQWSPIPGKVLTAQLASICFTSVPTVTTTNWQSVTYSPDLDLFVAVGIGGATRVMTSADRGATWTGRTAAAANSWKSVCCGTPGGVPLFVAVSTNGTNRVMTSPNGVTWTSVTPTPPAQAWQTICWGNGLFVAASTDGGTHNVMTSPDGVNWTPQTLPGTASGLAVTSVTWGRGLYVLVGGPTGGNSIFTSPDAVTWTVRNGVQDTVTLINGVCYGNGTYVACCENGSDPDILVSSDATTWALVDSGIDNYYLGVCWGRGMFVAVAQDFTGTRCSCSLDGRTWVRGLSGSDETWQSVAFGGDTFVAVASTGTSDRAMFAKYGFPPIVGAPVDTQGEAVRETVDTGATQFQGLLQANLVAGNTYKIESELVVNMGGFAGQTGLIDWGGLAASFLSIAITVLDTTTKAFVLTSTQTALGTLPSVTGPTTALWRLSGVIVPSTSGKVAVNTTAQIVSSAWMTATRLCGAAV